MSNCLTPAQIEGLLAGTLSAPEQRRAEEHVAACETCRRQVEARRTDEKLFGQIKEARQDETLLRAASPGGAAQGGPPIAESIEGYEILREIHRGGQGVVYKAVQKATKRTVALKVLLQGPYASPKQRHRFEREIDLVASLQHPNIVTIYDSGVAGGRHYFAMEYIHGQPLDAFLKNAKWSEPEAQAPGRPRGTTKPVARAAGSDVDDTLQLFNKICAAVNYAHQRGVIHRDLKPGNILVDSDGQPHVLDFGLAKSAGPDLHDGAPMTVTGEFMGTLAYASPEQTRGDPNLIDIRTDVYSLGVILYEMLTGKYPYPVVGQMGEVLRNIAETAPTRPSTVRRQVNDEVETIVLKALAKEKDRRYPSAEALGRDVERYLGGEAIEAKRDSGWYIIRKTLNRYRVPATIAGTFIVVLVLSTASLSVLYRRAVVAERDQSRAREEAVRERQRADEQRKLAEARQHETQHVADFQSKMLSKIDVAGMGRGLVRRLRDQVRLALERQYVGEYPNRRKRTPQEIEEQLKAFDDATGSANPTDAARQLMDEFILGRAAGALEKDLADQPQAAATIHDALGTTYQALGLYDAAEPHLRTALAMRERLYGHEHIDVAHSLECLAYLFYRKNDLAAVESLLRDALAIRRKLLGDEDLSTVFVWGNYIGSLFNNDKRAEALLEATKLTPIVLKSLNEDDARDFKQLVAEGASRWFAPKHEPLPQSLIKAIPRLIERILGPDNVRINRSISACALSLKTSGDEAGAEQLLREALVKQREILGDEHLDIAITLAALASCLESKGDHAGAEPLLRQALEIRRRLQGDEHPDVTNSLAALAYCLGSKGDHAGAESLYRQALAMQRKLLGNEHSATLWSMQCLAYAYSAQGKYADAEPLYLEALAARRKVSGASHPEIILVFRDLIALYVKQERLDDARPLIVEQIQYQRAAADRPGASAKDLDECAMTLLTFEPAELRDPVAALGYARRAVEASGGKDGGIMDTLSLAYSMTGDHPRAVETEEKAIGLLPPGDSPTRDELEANLARFRRAATSQPATSRPEPAVPQQPTSGPANSQSATTRKAA